MAKIKKPQKVKYGEAWYKVKDIRVSCGCTWYGIQDEPKDNPCHIDWISNVDDIMW